MHTARPGSPFSVIISDVKSISQKDLEECAIFTACFSQMWKSGQKYVSVHVFDSDSLYKSNKMNQGTWGIKASPKEIKVKLELVLTVQEEILRAVPEISVKSKKDILLKIMPGKISKSELMPKIAIELEERFSSAEILTALPAGGVRIIRK